MAAKERSEAKLFCKHCYIAMDMFARSHQTLLLLLNGLINFIWNERVWVPRYVEVAVFRLNSVLFESDRLFDMVYFLLPYFDDDMSQYYQARMSEIFATENEIFSKLYDFSCVVPNCVAWDGRYVVLRSDTQYRRCFLLE